MTTAITSNASDSALLVNGQTALQFNAGGTQGRIPSITCTQNAGALTFGLNPCVLDFRQTTLTTGVTVPRLVNAALTLALPSGGTLGAVTTVSARTIVVAIDNAGTVELAVVNIAGGNDLSETGVINTTAISAASTANNVFYSTTARTGVTYRVVGSVDAVNTAGAWGNPTLVQGAGGQAVKVGTMGQSWQNMTGSRALTTNYYNTTGKEIHVSVVGTLASAATYGAVVNGVMIGTGSNASTADANLSIYFAVPAGNSYQVSQYVGTPTFGTWYEKR